MNDVLDSEIRKAIDAYRSRLEVAQRALERLPAGYLPYREHKRLEAAQRNPESEIETMRLCIGRLGS